MTLEPSGPSRKQQFVAALALAGMTSVYWRTRVYRVSNTHLNNVLRTGEGASPELTAAIDALIRKYLPESVAA